MLQKCSREELESLLFLATHLEPTSRLPSSLGLVGVLSARLRLDKAECFELLKQEYINRGCPLAGGGYDGPAAHAEVFRQLQVDAEQDADAPHAPAICEGAWAGSSGAGLCVGVGSAPFPKYLKATTFRVPDSDDDDDDS